MLDNDNPQVEPSTAPEIEPAGDREEPSTAPEIEPAGEEVSSLATLQLFKFEGRIYSKRRQHSGSVTGLSKKGDKVIKLPPDTIVEPYN